MSRSHNEDIKYVYDLPYFERRELCRILDLHDKWEELAGIYMKFDIMKIHALRREIMRGNSPSEELLTMWGQQNHTVLELFALLSKMQHYQAMLAIKKFVDAEYHRLIYEGEENMSRLMSKHTPHNNNTANSNHIEPVAVPGPSGVRREHVNQQTSYKTMDIDQYNMNMSGFSNEMPEKVFFSRTDNTEEKIINVDYNPAPPVPDRNSNNGSNAQTVMLNAANHQRSPRTPSDQSNNPPQSPQDRPTVGPLRDHRITNVSDISSLAETVGTIPHISFKELEIATNSWDPQTILGKGGFGTVYKGTWKNTYVAIKRTRNTESDENHTIQIQQILGELKMLNSYRHDNILPLYGFSVGGEDPCLVYQFMPHGSLDDRLRCKQNTPPLTWSQRQNIATGTARGLQFLHTIGDKPLIHGDIKSGNILLDLNYEPRIGDFGLAREGPYNHYTHMKLSRVHGTRPYLPDEFLRAKKFSTKVDTYSFGIVMFELATGQRAYDEHKSYKFLKDHVENETNIDTLIDRRAGTDEQEIFSTLIVLGKLCISKRPKDRPEMVAVLERLNLVTATRDMAARVQSMIRQNSLTPSNPYERQLLHDQLSQQRKPSQTLSTTPGQHRAYSPQPPTLLVADSNLHQVPTPGYRTPSPNNPFLTPSDGPAPAVVHPPVEVVPRDRLPAVVETIPRDRLPSPVESITRDKLPAAVGAVPRDRLPSVVETVPRERLPTVVQEEVKSPEIAVSPPSENDVLSSSSSSSSADETEGNVQPSTNEPPPQECNDSQDCYSYVDTVLPLISVLGVKVPDKEKEKVEEAEESTTNDSTRAGTSKSTAEGKIPWILGDT